MNPRPSLFILGLCLQLSCGRNHPGFHAAPATRPAVPVNVADPPRPSDEGADRERAQTAAPSTGPLPRRLNGPPPLLGLSTSGEATRELSAMRPALQASGASTFRLSFSWTHIEPIPDQWNFAWQDRAVQRVQEAGVEPTAILITSPPWAITGTGKQQEMTMTTSRMDAWSSFVQRTVARYGDRVRYWEVWNEPNAPKFNRGNHSPAHYAELAHHACSAAKQRSPQAQVGIGAANFDVRYLRLVIQAMKPRGLCFDFIAVHPYELLDALRFAGGEAQFLQIASHLRAMLREVAPEKANVPIWFTEIGNALPSAAAEETQASLAASERLVADLMVKAYALSAIQGIEHLQWFELKDAGGSRGHGLLDDDLRKRVAYTTFQTLATSLGDRPEYVGWIPLAQEGRGFLFQRIRDGAYVLIAWMPPGQRGRWDGPPTSELPTSGRRPLETQASVITEHPAVLLLASSDADSLASVTEEARRHRPDSPWPPTSDASAALATLGTDPQSSGLRLLAPSSTVVEAFADGTSGAALRAGTSAYRFAVDPPLNRYDLRTWCVTIRARALGGLAKGQYAGMNLLYQPVEGQVDHRPMYPYANVGEWYSLPDDERWHTHRWCVQDAMMVHTFGFAFQLSVEESAPFALGEVRLSLPEVDNGPP